MCAAVQTDRLIDTWVMQISRREIYLFGSPLYRRRACNSLKTQAYMRIEFYA